MYTSPCSAHQPLDLVVKLRAHCRHQTLGPPSLLPPSRLSPLLWDSALILSSTPLDTAPGLGPWTRPLDSAPGLSPWTQPRPKTKLRAHLVPGVRPPTQSSPRAGLEPKPVLGGWACRAVSMHEWAPNVNLRQSGSHTGRRGQGALP